ncbi:glutamate receptor ionotropic, delta-2-like [Littorina saxatilis]|uniref:glutamate receptor ionotropic, delta-2-like n=1 Tax=Littorina saxatilis TaxID=31220 RepID=UPI0038B679C9
MLGNELDLAIGPFTITSKRENVIDFTVPFMQDGGAILTKRSQPGPDILTVFKPLPLAMWLSVGGALIVTGTALYVITSAAAARRRHFGKEDGDKTWWSFGDSVFIVYGSLVEQGASRHPESSAGRLVLGCWWLFTILIVSIYTASLAAQLTVTVHERTVDTLQDLVSSSLTPLTLSGTTWQSSFQNDSSEMYRAIGARMTTVLDENEVADLVMNNDLAYIMDVSALDFLQMQDCKHLHRSEHIFAVNGLGLAVPQGAKYKNLINNVILKLQESGVINIWKRRWWQASSTDCDGQDSVKGKRTVAEGSRPLELVSIGGILILYGAVIVFAFFCFLLQKVCECGRVRAWKERIMDKCGVARYHF